MRNAIRLVAPLVAALIVTAACNAPRASTTPTPSTSGTPNFTGKTLNIVTGGTGAVYIVYGAGLAELLNKKLGTAASAQSTTASVDNMKLIRDGKADLAFTLADTAFDAVNGKGSFASPEKPSDAKALAVLYSNLTHLVVKESGGINTVPDLKGKRVSMGSAGSGTEIIANRTLEAYGLDPAKDISRERLGAQDSANALRDGKIDAFFFSGGLPVPAVLDLATGTKIKMIDLADSIQKMTAKYGNFYFPIKIPKSTYNTAADVTVSGVANLLVVPTGFDPALAQAILATMFDNKADLVKVHSAANDLSLESAVVGSPIDYHQGAIDFYKSKGVWKK
ncbi:MAG TPA: TAXI family TRAP transporter solute-binding subunit [Candidatus Polarisedimenticolia bacterium]|nr:TAXI family TRAP transporter solute-binding subunit [Candidatus Polarisedimenticolia bacterium]